MAENKIVKILAFVAIAMSISGCSMSGNVKRDFDCKAEEGDKCQKIRASDKKSQKRLEEERESLKSGNCDCGIKKEYKIKYAPYVDEDGNYHKEREVMYHGEYK